MGRSFESVRMGVRDLSARWARAGRALKKEDQVYGTRARCNGKEALQRGVLRPGRSPGGGGLLRAY